VPENAPEIRKAQQPPASNSFVPPVAGLIMVSVVVRDLLAAAEKKRGSN
jgi:tRNA A37 threonylcarbamoyladenosine dehydratase